jgi:hypothetical protein
MFANRYLEKNKRKPLISEKPHSNLGIAVVIPCYREDEILKTLNSLLVCEEPNNNVEIIVVVNHSVKENSEIKDFNLNSKKEIQNWIVKNRNEKYSFFVLGPLEFPKKWAGVGLARKSGMDEAVLRFNFLNNPNGIVVSLDADTLVEKNYFVAIEKHFKNNKNDVGATINFKHQTREVKGRHLEGIQLYEKYMAYYRNSLRFTGYPFPMFTVGSAFAVKAESYVKRGGMNRRQAGEDFYFLQNLAQIGNIGEIVETTVFPSSRLSDRVPFGTGPILKKWLAGEEDLTETYNFQAFEDLKLFFDKKEKLFGISESEYLKQIAVLPKPVREFLIHSEFWIELKDLNHNCSSQKTFSLRFFHKFNAFKILKFLNFSHEFYYPKKNLMEQLALLNKKR